MENTAGSVREDEMLSSSKTWKAPAVGSIKCNVDATLFSDPNMMGFGGIVHDNWGNFLATCHGSFKGRFPPF